MRIILRLLLITFSVVTCSDAAAPEATAPANGSEFIRTSCETTLYPELCYDCLSGYANSVQQDPARLARVAVSVSLSRATNMSVYLANLSRRRGSRADPRAAAALHDCLTVFRDAVDQIRGSLQQMRRLTGSGEELRFRMSNVQTWMSAALTNEDTCTDGFDDVVDCPVKMDVCNRTVRVKEVTSNALALVNNCAAKATLP